MHDLEMPFALAGLEIHADQAFSEQVVSRTVTAVKIRTGRLNRQVHQAEFFVDRHLRPDAVVAVGRPGAVFPRIVAELSGSGNGIESPQEFSTADIVGSH